MISALFVRSSYYEIGVKTWLIPNSKCSIAFWWNRSFNL